MSAHPPRDSDAPAGLGYPLLLSASNKRFLGELLGLDINDRRDASLAAAAYGVGHGARIVRVHDVAGTGPICRPLGALLPATPPAGPPPPTRRPANTRTRAAHPPPPPPTPHPPAPPR